VQGEGLSERIHQQLRKHKENSELAVNTQLCSLFPVSCGKSSCTCLTLFPSVAMVDSVDLDTFNNLSDEELHELSTKVYLELGERNLTLRSFPRHEDEVALLASVNALDMGRLEKVFVLVAVCRICKFCFLCHSRGRFTYVKFARRPYR
jgi:hypothetical protein